MLARIPAIKWGLENHPHVSMTVYWQDYFVELASYLIAHPRLTHKKLSDAKYNMEKPVLDFDPNRIISLGMHLTQHAFVSLYDKVATPEMMQYPEANRYLGALPIGYDECYDAVVFTTAATAPSREWPSYEVNSLAVKVREAGLTPVLLGNTDPIPTGDKGNIQGVIDDGIDRSLFLDLTNRTSLIEALGIMQRSRAVLGVDNGLLHLAHYSTVPIVAGYTSVEGSVRVPFRANGHTKVISAQVPCGGCQSKTQFVNHDYRFCLFKDFACTLTMTASRFETALKELDVL